MRIQTIAALAVALAIAAPAAAQSPVYQAKKARRHFISVTYDWQFVQPHGFSSTLEQFGQRTPGEATAGATSRAWQCGQPYALADLDRGAAVQPG